MDGGTKPVNAFESYHPAVLLFYFLSVTLLTMFTSHPVILLLSVLSAVCFFGMLARRRELRSSLAFYIPAFLLIAVTNPLFSHNGVTPLFYLNDNPVTLEAVLYGAAIAAMLIAVVYWFKCFSEVMTSDKFLYLFGQAIPRLSLILSMALRFLPLFRQKARSIRRTQKTLGLYASKSITDRVQASVRVFSALVTWSLENAVETADSMKARGYGLAGRTSFSLFRFTGRDGALLAVSLLLFLPVCLGYGRYLGFGFYPEVTPLSFRAPACILYFLLFLLMFLPFFIEIKEAVTWKYLRSKI